MSEQEEHNRSSEDSRARSSSGDSPVSQAGNGPEKRDSAPEHLKESPDPFIGRLLGGQYRLIEKIGQGAMGSVYRAEQAVIERIVAVKVLHTHLTKNEEYIRRFRREAFVASKLTHPNVVRLFDFGVEDGMPYLAMQFAAGRSLKRVLLEEGAMPAQRVASILRQIGGALSQAHAQGIIHRDLKPDNIMIAAEHGEERAYILDFGIAKPITDQSLTIAGSLTKAGFFIGTPLYMAPEQALDRPLDSRSDIYSLGVILYEMLSGETPFKSESPMEMMMKHINAVPVPVREFKPALRIPRRVSEVVHRALAKDPNNRFQTVDELVAAFTDALTTDDEPLASTIPAQKRGPLGKRAQLAFAIAVTVILLGGASAYFLGVKSELLGGERTPATRRDETPAPTDEVQPVEKLASNSQPREEQESLPSQETVTVSADLETALSPRPHLQPLETTVPVTVVAEGNPPQGTHSPPSPMPETGETLPPPEVPSEPPALTTTGVSPSTENATPLAPQEVAAANGNESVPQGRAGEIEGSTGYSETRPSDAQRGDELLLQLMSPPEQFTEKRLSKEASRREAERLYREGEKRLEEKSYLEAGIRFREALGYRADHLGARLSLGVCLLRLGHPDAAYEHFSSALKIDPEYAPTHYNLATYYAVKNDREKAMLALKRAITLYPKVKSWARNDPDFILLKDDPEFTKLLE